MRGGRLARRCCAPWHHGVGSGTGRALPQHPGGLGTVPARPAGSSGPSLPISCLSGECPQWGFWKQPGNGQFGGQEAGGSDSSGLLSPSHGEGAGADMGGVSRGWHPPGPNLSRAGACPLVLLRGLSPGCSDARASKGSQCLLQTLANPWKCFIPILALLANPLRFLGRDFAMQLKSLKRRQ